VSEDALAEARHEAQAEAVPFVLLALAAMLGLSALSAIHDWELFGHSDWWLWIVLAVPLLALAVTLLTGLGRGGAEQHRRRALATSLIAAVVAGSVAGIVAIVTSLATSVVTGGQLLASAAVILLTNVIAFGLALWELDCGGPVARSVTPRGAPDLQFPQDENPELARPGWSPHLLDYVYVSLTNSIAFSPTDAMPLTRPTKLLMAGEALASAVTVLVVAARAINVIA
jgi:hypothetical protein